MSDELQDRINSLLAGETTPADAPEIPEKPAMPEGSALQNDMQSIIENAMESGGGVDSMDDMESLKKKNLNMILDIPLEVSVELGRNKMLINDLLQLGQGSVIELNKLAGEPLEVLVNGRLVARGEVVVIHDKFGVRLTDIISANERIAQLGS